MIQNSGTAKTPRNYLAMQDIEMRAYKHYLRAIDLGVSKRTVTPLYGAIYYLSLLDVPSDNALAGANKIASQLAAYSDPTL